MKYCYSFFLLFVINAFSNYLPGQNCVNASWVKAYTSGASTIVFTKTTVNDSNQIYVLGSFTGATATLGSTVLTQQGASTAFVARMDTAGLIQQAFIVGYTPTVTANNYFVLKDIEADNLGNVYICGYYKGTGLHFGNLAFSNAGMDRLFFAKFRPPGAPAYCNTAVNYPIASYAYSIAVDTNYNAYICGGFSGAALNLHDTVLVNTGITARAFFAKYDSTGHMLMARRMGGWAGSTALTINVDANENIYISGSATSTNLFLEFDPVYHVQSSQGNGNIFAAKYNGATGMCVWGKISQSFSALSEYPDDAALDSAGNLYVTGYSSAVAFDSVFLAPSDQNGFLAKFDGTNGTCKWAKSIGNTGTNENGNAVCVKGNRLAICGKLSSNRPYIGNYPLYCMGNNSYFPFYAKMDLNGNIIWARGSQTSNSDGIVMDNTLNVYVVGVFNGTQTWYPVTLTTAIQKPYMAKFVERPWNNPFTVSGGIDLTKPCAGSITINGSTSPAAVTVGWYPDLGTAADVSKTPSVSPAMTTDYFVYGYYQGCVSVDTVRVNVTSNGLTVTSIPDAFFCAGDSVHLVTNTNLSGATYSWLPPIKISSTTAQSPYVKPGSPLTYTVTATQGGCTAQDTVAITSHPKPFIDLPYDYIQTNQKYLSICNPINVNVGLPVNTYTWPVNTNITNVNNNTATIQVPATSYYVKVSALSSYGCYARDSVLVSQTAPYPAGTFMTTIPSVAYKCPGANDSLFIRGQDSNSNSGGPFSQLYGAQVDSGLGGGWRDIHYQYDYDFVHYTVGSVVSQNYCELHINNVNPSQSGFRFRFYSIGDCDTGRTYSIVHTLYVGPTITAQPISPSLCIGENDSLQAIAVNGNGTYVWEELQGNNFVPLVNQPGLLFAVGNKLYIQNAQVSIDGKIVRCRAAGCATVSNSYSDTALIHVAGPNLSSQLSFTDTLCDGSSTQLEILNTAANGFQWFANNVSLSNSNPYSGTGTSFLSISNVTGLSGVNYYCQLTNTQCGYTINSDTVHFTILPNPTVTLNSFPTSCANDPAFLLTQGSPTGGIYSGTGISSGYFDPSVSGVGSFPVTYSYTDQYGCTNSAVNSISVSVCTAVPQNNLRGCSIVYNDHSLMLIDMGKTEFQKVIVYDGMGRQIDNVTVSNKEVFINKSGWSAGLYVLVFMNSNQSMTWKIMQQ